MWYIAFGTTTTSGRANLCPQFGKKNIPSPIRELLGANKLVMLTPVIHSAQHSCNRTVCSCFQGLKTIRTAHRCVWMDSRKEFVPLGFHRWCNDGYLVAAGVKNKHLSKLCLKVFYAHACSVLLSLSFSLSMLQAKRQNPGKNWVTLINYCGHELSPVHLYCFKSLCSLRLWMDFWKTEVPSLVIASYAQRKAHNYSLRVYLQNFTFHRYNLIYFQ